MRENESALLSQATVNPALNHSSNVLHQCVRESPIQHQRLKAMFSSHVQRWEGVTFNPKIPVAAVRNGWSVVMARRLFKRQKGNKPLIQVQINPADQAAFRGKEEFN